MGDPYPSLGFDPCPGDLAGYEALAAYATRSAAALAAAARTLTSAGSEQWRGQAADAFRAHVRVDVLPLASGAAESLTEVMTTAPTWAGVVSKVPLATRIPVAGKAIQDAEKTVEVAPGIFRMIGASLREAGGDPTAAAALSKAVKGFDSYGAWRAVDIVSGQSTWAFSGAGIQAIPGTVHNWVDNLASGKSAWQEPADAAAG